MFEIASFVLMVVCRNVFPQINWTSYCLFSFRDSGESKAWFIIFCKGFLTNIGVPQGTVVQTFQPAPFFFLVVLRQAVKGRSD